MAEEAMVKELLVKEEKEPAADIKKYLIFSSNEKLFGVDTDYVETILTETTITYVPMLPGHIRGVINMRGLIVPIIDFRLLLNQGMSDSQCVVVLKDDDTYVGILVDDVDEMEDVGRKEILPVPFQGNQALHNLVSGMCSLPDGTGTMLVLDCLFLFNQISRVDMGEGIYMRITPNNRVLINPALSNAAAGRTRANSSATEGAVKAPEAKFDTVTIGAENTFQKQLQSTTGTISSLREQVQAGEYKVDAQNIARRLLFFGEV